MSSTIKNPATEHAASKTRTRKKTEVRGDEFKQKPDETFEQFYARMQNIVYDSYARARQAEQDAA